jgi:hypothetical protein
VFDGGDMCGGNIARSFTVKLACGAEEKLHGGEEPATCKYTINLTTPLACTAQDLQQV